MNFLVFLLTNPKISVNILVVAVAQILKYSGIVDCDEATVNKIADSVSILAGVVGLYFATKSEYPAGQKQALQDHIDSLKDKLSPKMAAQDEKENPTPPPPK